jgi:hypothetical protein
MIDFILGIIVYVIVLFMATGLSNRSTRAPYLFFVSISFVLGMIQAYFTSLPQGGGDARGFMRIAVMWSADGFWRVLDYYTGPSSYFLAWLHAVMFSFTGPSELMVNAFSGLFTLIAIHAGVKISTEVWGDWVQARVAWLACLFPTLLLHSAIMLREAYLTAFFAIGILYTVRWRRSISTGHFIMAQLFFGVTIFFHGAMIVANIALLFYAIIFFGRVLLSRMHKDRNVLHYIFLIASYLTVFAAFMASGINLPKVGNISEFFASDSAVESILAGIGGGGERTDAGSAHPSWTIIRSNAEIIPKLPIRFVYSTFSPFPWDVSSPRHLIGLLDSFLYLSMFFVIYKYRLEIKKRPEVLVIIFMCLICLIVFSLGVSNFGTSIRHRAKFVVPLIAIAAPFLPRIRL